MLFTLIRLQIKVAHLETTTINIELPRDICPYLNPLKFNFYQDLIC